MTSRQGKYLVNGTAVGVAALIAVALLGAVGLFAWWAFTWTTHTLVWFIFIFGSVLGSVKVSSGK